LLLCSVIVAQNQSLPVYQNQERTALSTCQVEGTDFGLDVEFFAPNARWSECSVFSGAATVFYPFEGSGSVEVCVDLPGGNEQLPGIRLYNRGDFGNPTTISTPSGAATRLCQTVTYPRFNSEGDILGFETLSFYVSGVGALSDPAAGLAEGVTGTLTLPGAGGGCTLDNPVPIGFRNRVQQRFTGQLSGTFEDVTYNIPNGANLSDLYDDSWLFKFQSPSVSANRSVTIILDGTLNVDVDYTLGQNNGSISTLTLLGDSRINVKSGNTLRIREVEIAGCLTLWDAIVVEDGATLILEETVLTNGENAVRVEDGGNLIVRNAEFKGNHVGIFSPNDPNEIARQRTDISVLGSNFDFRVGSGLNTEDVLFSPDPILLNPRFGETPRAGAELNDIGNVAVFANGGINNRRNEFKNIANGLILNESKVSISGSEFDDLPSVLGQGPSGNGVLVTGDTYNFSTYRVEISSDENMSGGFGDVDFTRMETAVRINRGAQVNVFGTTMSFVENGLVSSDATVIRFYDNEVTATQNGFARFGPSFIGRSYVRNNTFVAQSLHGGIAEPAAIRLVGGNFSSRTHSVWENDITLDGAIHGLISTALSGVKVRDNTFNWEAGKMFGTHAVTLFGGGYPLITGNLIQGVTGAPFTETDGIRMFMTDRPTVGCNTFKNVETQLTFFGNNQRARVQGNNFFDGGIGLKYGDPLVTNDPTFTGPQVHKANRWIGPFQGFEAAFYNGTSLEQSLSRFVVDTDDGTDFLPTMFNPGVNTWFSNDVGSNTPFYTCPSGTPPTPNNLQGGGVIKDIVDGTYQPANTWQATRWLADSRVQRAFVNKEFTAQTYQSWQRYKAEGKVVTASDFQAVESLLSVSGSDDIADYETIGILSEDAEALQQQYASATVQALGSGTISATMDANRVSLLQNIAEVEESIAVYNNSFLASATQGFALAKSLNASLSPNIHLKTSLPAKNQKFINALIVEIFEQGMDAAVFDAKTLTEIAVQCPLNGGEAVYQARALAESLNVKYNTADVDDCTGAGSKNNYEDTEIALASGLQIYPNPAQQFVEFSSGDLAITTIEVSDARGRLLIHEDYANLPRAQGRVELTGLKAGVYFFKTIAADETIRVDLLIVK